MGAIVSEMFALLAPVCIAFLLGVFVGWAWKPKRASFWNSNFDSSAPFNLTANARTQNLSSVVDSFSEKDQIVLPPVDTAESR